MICSGAMPAAYWINAQVLRSVRALNRVKSDRHELSIWVRKADELGSYNALAQNMVDTLKPGADTATLVRLVGSNLLNTPEDDAFVEPG